MPKETETIKLDKQFVVELLDGSLIGSYILIQELPVEDNGKYQTMRYVFMNIITRKFYMYTADRTGSYFDEYNYEYGEDKDNKVTLYQVSIRASTTFRWS